MYINMLREAVRSTVDLPVRPLTPPPVEHLLEEVILDPGDGYRAPPPSPVVQVEGQVEVVEPLEPPAERVEAQLEAVAAALVDRGTGSRRSTRSQSVELVAGLESDRRPKRKLSVSDCILYLYG